MDAQEQSPAELDAAYKPFPPFAAWLKASEIDFTRWNSESALLRDRVQASSDVLDRARLIATRAAAIDTGALENLYESDRGFTYTVAFETTGWELEVAARGEQVRLMFEAQLAAYEYVLTLATGAEPVSEAAIRELHTQMCAAQPTYRVETAIGPREQSLPKGVYKALPNHVRTRRGTTHSYAPVDMTPAEMHRLVLELRTAELASAHPIVQAAYAHYCLVVIHPFADGNGRVARALASAYSYRAISVPIVIFSEQKPEYLDVLERADKGDYQAFTKFLLVRSSETVELVLESLKSHPVEAEEVGRQITELFHSSIVRRSEVDRLGEVLLDAIESSLLTNAAKLRLHDFQFEVFKDEQASSSEVSEHRVMGKVINTTVTFKGKVSASHDSSIRIVLPDEALLDSLIAIQSHDELLELSVRLEQLKDRLSPALRLRTDLFAERYWGHQLSELKPRVQEAIAKRF